MTASADHRRSAPAGGTLLAALQARASNALHALDAMTPPRAPLDATAAAAGWGHALGAAMGGAGAALHNLGARAGGASAEGGASGGSGGGGDFDNTPLPPLQPLLPLQLTHPDPFDDRPATCKPKVRRPASRDVAA